MYRTQPLNWLTNVLIYNVNCESHENSYKTFLFKIDTSFWDQVYSNTRVPTQVNTRQHESDSSQHESARVPHESTRINTSPTQVNKSPTRVNTNLRESDMSQHELTRVQHDSKRINKSQLDHKVIAV